jgi:hypothetical protein
MGGIKSDEKSHTFGLPGHAGACRGLDLNLLLSPGLPLPWSCPSLPWFAYPRRRSVTAVGKIRWSSDCEISREAVSFWGRPSITRIDRRSIYGLVNWGFWTNDHLIIRCYFCSVSARLGGQWYQVKTSDYFTSMYIYPFVPGVFGANLMVLDPYQFLFGERSQF